MFGIVKLGLLLHKIEEILKVVLFREGFLLSDVKCK